MAKTRIEETDSGIQAAVTVRDFDRMQRGFRDRGFLTTDAIISSGIDSGTALEIGPGPGYLGLEWLKATDGSTLIAVEISREMIRMAERNRRDYSLDDRAEYQLGNALEIPFEDNSVDHVFSNGSLHEWADPPAVLREVFRVLRPEGRLYISDLKRNLNPLVRGMMRFGVRKLGDSMRAGLDTSIRAAYLPEEMRRLMEWSPFSDFRVDSDPFGLNISARRIA